MSRVAKNPIPIPENVEVTVTAAEVTVKGPLGSLTRSLTPEVSVERAGNMLQCKAVHSTMHSNAMSGTTRALIANMVKGVTQGFEKKLSLVGVGYRAQVSGSDLNLSLGFSHPIVHRMPAGIKAETPSQTEIVIKGVDRQLVGQVAADVRGYRPPEPYKGKGIRYADEVVVLKETKKK